MSRDAFERKPFKLLRILLLAIVCQPVSSLMAQQWKPIVINPDGAWCWFQDERAVILNGKLLVSSITGSGAVQVTSLDLESGVLRRATLNNDFGHDDHNVAGLLVRQDGRVMAFYTKHHEEARMYHRLTKDDEAFSRWEPEQQYSAGVTAKFTYANPFQLKGENGKIYNFWRGIDFNPTWSVSADGGRTWSTGQNHIYFKKGERPYVKYASDGIDTIHFAFTEAHPDRPIQTSLYHAFYQAGALHRSDGTMVRELSEGPITPPEATLIYDGTDPSQGEAWVWDLSLADRGRPIIVYTSHVSPGDIRYRYARWDGDTWVDQQIAFGGKRLYPSQEFYAGGISLDPDDPSVVYLSSDVNILDGSSNQGGHYEIYKGVTRDGGKRWEWRALTTDSEQDNLRPIVPANHPGYTFVVWFRGTYGTYTDYETEIVLHSDIGLKIAE
jgi:hypothetical protein